LEGDLQKKKGERDGPIRIRTLLGRWDRKRRGEKGKDGSEPSLLTKISKRNNLVGSRRLFLTEWRKRHILKSNITKGVKGPNILLHYVLRGSKRRKKGERGGEGNPGIGILYCKEIGVGFTKKRLDSGKEGFLKVPELRPTKKKRRKAECEVCMGEEGGGFKEGRRAGVNKHVILL